MVRMLTTDEYLIPSNDGPRRPKPSDMALLMRSTSNQLSFEKTFRKYSIPYTLQAARSLMLEAPANDLYAMLQLTLYPSDKLSYMSALRSPFCNISDEGVYASLTGGRTTHSIGTAVEKEVSQVFIAISLENLPDRATIEEKISASLADLKSSEALDADNPVRFPGERRIIVREQNIREGIPVDEKIWEKIWEKICSL